VIIIVNEPPGTAAFLDIATAELVPTAVMGGRDPVVWVSSLIWFNVQTSSTRRAAFSLQGGRFAEALGRRSARRLVLFFRLVMLTA
jgi:hypothetical protein